MSIFHPVTLGCAKCGTKSKVERVASVNADRRPDLRDRILDGSFQATTCPKCGSPIRLPPHLIYLELKRKVWIAAEPAEMIEDWSAVEQSVFKTYNRSFGEDAPESGQELGEGVQPRLVFGWPAFREKLICADLDLDDVTLELLKMAIMRAVDGPPMADQTELRLVGGTAEELEFVWFVTATEQHLAGLKVERDIYDGILEQPEIWASARERLEGVFLVDLRRMIAGRDTAKAA